MRLPKLLCLIALVCSCDSGVEPLVWVAGSSREPIINGTAPTSPTDDAVVALVYPGYGFFCSATLITPTVVLTAAHCLESGGPIVGEAQIFFGDDVDGIGQTRGIARASVHTQYDVYDVQYDIGFVEMSSAAPAGITPIPHLPASLGLTGSDEGMAIRSIGFGLTELDGAGTKLQFSGTLLVVCDGSAYCDVPGVGPSLVVPRALAYSNALGGPCSGDSGGAALVTRNGQEYLAGIISYGDGNCTSFGVDTLVDSYASMVDDFISGIDFKIPGSGGGGAVQPCPDCNVGIACTSHSQCGSSGYCLGVQDAPEVVGGYCISFCSFDSDCPGDAVCDADAGGGACWDGCVDNSDCRSGYSCQWVQLSSNICMPQAGGTGSSPMGGECTSDIDCADSGYCYSETEYGYPGGFCGKSCGDDDGCPAGSSCILNWCMADCIYRDDCRDEYACMADEGTVDRGGCVFACTNGANCSGETCNAYGLCGDETPPRTGARPTSSTPYYTSSHESDDEGCVAVRPVWAGMLAAGWPFWRRRRTAVRARPA